MDKSAIVDIDNTLWPFCDALYVELRKVHDRFPEPSRWFDWDFWENYVSKHDFFHAINAVHYKQDYDFYNPYPEARDFLLELRRAGFHITIASHRNIKTFKMTENWLNKHGLVYDSIHLSYNKTKLFNMFTSIVVDDSPEVLDKAYELGVNSTGLIHPWNTAHLKKGFNLYNNLDDVLSYIRGLNNG